MQLDSIVKIESLVLHKEHEPAKELPHRTKIWLDIEFVLSKTVRFYGSWVDVESQNTFKVVSESINEFRDSFRWTTNQVYVSSSQTYIEIGANYFDKSVQQPISKKIPILLDGKSETISLLVDNSEPDTPIPDKTKPNTMIQKNFFQSAIGSILRFGKNNGIIQWLDGKFSAKLPDGTTHANIAVADAVADEDAVTLKQLNTRIAELAKKGGMIVADLASSSNPWNENEIRITNALEFQRNTNQGAETFSPTDGTIFSVAKDLTIDAGKIIGKDAETALKADHVYIYDQPTGKAYDNGAIASTDWVSNGLLLRPSDPSVKEIQLENNDQGLNILRIANSNDSENYAGSVVELKGSGDAYTNNMFMGKYGKGYYTPEYRDNGVVATDKRLVFVSANNTNAGLDFCVGGDYMKPNKVAVVTPDKGLVYDKDYTDVFEPNSAVSKKYVDRLISHTAYKLPILIDSAGKASEIDPIPANAIVVGSEVIVSEAFDGTINGLKIQFADTDLIDFSLIELNEVSKMPIPAYAKEAEERTPTVVGSVDGGSTGHAVVLIEYVIA